jgi:hypothetical protein
MNNTEFDDFSSSEDSFGGFTRKFNRPNTLPHPNDWFCSGGGNT